MPSAPAITDTTARTVDEQFLDLICSDADLLAAEFDAIIAAEWPKPPADMPGRGAAGAHPGSGAARRAAEPDRGPVAPPRHPAIRGWARQRSPPSPTPDAQQAGRQVIATREPTLTR
jgi:hypothetical protein